MTKSKTFGKLLPGLIMPLMICLLLHPQTAAAAVREALRLWAQTVVPTLLPFMILTELLVAIGGAQLLGRNLSPLMDPLFRLPGSAGVGVVLGLAAGFPSGAAVTAALRRQGSISAEEAARLLAFTNNAGPLYILGAVAGEMLGCPAAGLVLAVSSYGLNLLYGIILGFIAHQRRYVPSGKKRTETTHEEIPQGQIPLPQALKAAAQRAAANVILIACLMALFAALAQLLCPPSWNGRPLGAVSAGLLEMSLGTAAWAGLGRNVEEVLPWIAAQLAFGGLCVQMQVLAMIADTDISPRLYLLGRALHPAAAWLLTAVWLRIRPVLQTVSTAHTKASAAACSTAGFLVLTALVLMLLGKSRDS